MPILWVFFNCCFHCLERLVCYIKRRKSFFHDLFSRSITWQYRGLPGVTGGYKGLQGVTKDSRNFFLTGMFPDTIMHKNQS